MVTGRRYKRLSTSGMKLHSETAFETKVEILDISVGGASVRGTKYLKPGIKCVVKLKNKDTFIPLKGTVVWENVSGSTIDLSGDVVTFYMAGIKFDNIFFELSESADSMDGYYTLNELRLSGSRFKILSHGTALLNYQENFIVRSLSLGGMLIESLNEIHFNMKYPMGLFLPGENSPVNFQGRVVSSELMRAKNKKIYYIGIAFLDMTENDRSRLNNFISILSEI
jgi:hypothetical protein